MGNCCDRCLGRFDRRKYLRTRYNIEKDFSIEFDQLIDNEQHADELCNVVTDEEKALVKAKRFNDLVAHQKLLDREIERNLVKQEEELRMEEEAFYEAKREAARVAKAQKMKEQKVKNTSNWLGDEKEDWDVAGEEDFETFMESVKARSLAARTRAIASQVPVDTQSTTSSLTKERVLSESSSIDLEWEHEEGMEQLAQSRAGKKKNNDLNADLAELSVKVLKAKVDSSGGQTFLNNFTTTPDTDEDAAETRTLLARSNSADEEVDR
ncbi:DgyrCDS7865 [Dimorphilus gyrociliatus]|uniref:DgyrCDS7865 n=1 Tax=Dimorphilus gyrociliatus TaxID=2664684 RepID=A0A7I8VSD8_9ANNE|nr:DgyrCDS7865 [Dimorphilus gyrociliatus]